MLNNFSIVRGAGAASNQSPIGILFSEWSNGVSWDSFVNAPNIRNVSICAEGAAQAFESGGGGAIKDYENSAYSVPAAYHAWNNGSYQMGQTFPFTNLSGGDQNLQGLFLGSTCP